MPVIDVQREEEEARETKPKTFTWLALIILIISALIVGSVFGVIFLFSSRYQKQITTLEQEITVLKQEESKKKKDAEEATTVSKKLSELDKVLSEHICMTGIFEQLEKTTVKKVFFESLDLETTEGALSLQAKGATYQDVANQLAVWRKNDDFFQQVSVSEVSLDESVSEGERVYVSFSPEIKLEKSNFLCGKEEDKPEDKNNKS